MHQVYDTNTSEAHHNVSEDDSIPLHKKQIFAHCINDEGRVHILHSKLMSVLDGSTSDSHENWIR